MQLFPYTGLNTRKATTPGIRIFLPAFLLLSLLLCSVLTTRAGAVDRELVITSYSIHYTKLYDISSNAAS